MKAPNRKYYKKSLDNCFQGGKMNKKKILDLVLGLTLVFIVGYEYTAAVGNNMGDIASVWFKEIKRIDFRNLPETIDFTNPSRIAFNSRNELFVTDTRAHNIKVFNTQGKFLKVFGQEGKGPGDLNRPTGIIFNGRYMIIWELGNYRFSLFNEDGEFVRHVKSKQPAVVWKLKSLGNGQIAFEVREGDFENEKAVIYIMDKELEKQEKFYSHPIKRERYVNKIKDDVKIPFGPLVSWDVMGPNKIVIGYQEEYKIDVLTNNKEKLFSIEHQSRRVKVSKKDRDKYFSSMFYVINGQTRQGAPPLIKKYTRFPKLKPYYKDILVAPENNIWISIYTESGKEKLADVFERNGQFVKRIKIQGELGYSSVFAQDGTLWTVIEGDRGYHVVVQYQIKEYP
ncbi:MAG: 6-bladed beta-propeller [Candidatus Aminicenantes bacterium]|nr:6-bladed beta-propeller [Candidatus Aminicenantes bacterium]